MKKQVHLLIYGRVQGVFFRASAAQIARQLKLSGFARNLPDGGVEVVAEGEEEFLKKMAGWCHKGPVGAYVERVDVEWNEATERFTSFGIR